MNENMIPGLSVGVSTWGDDFDEARAIFIHHNEMPADLPTPPLRLSAWTLDIGLPLDGMGFRFECDFAGIDAMVPCEVSAGHGSVDVERGQGIDDLQNDEVELPEAVVAWLEDACPRVVRHLFAPLLAR